MLGSPSKARVADWIVSCPRSPSVRVTRPEPFGVHADDAQRPVARAVGRDRFHPHRLAELRPGQDLSLLRQHGALPGEIVAIIQPLV
jgi:hypothetical protein